MIYVLVFTSCWRAVSCDVPSVTAEDGFFQSKAECEAHVPRAERYFDIVNSGIWWVIAHDCVTKPEWDSRRVK